MRLGRALTDIGSLMCVLMWRSSPVVVTVLHTRYWRHTGASPIWLFIQIAYIAVYVSWPLFIHITHDCKLMPF